MRWHVNGVTPARRRRWRGPLLVVALMTSGCTAAPVAPPATPITAPAPAPGTAAGGDGWAAVPQVAARLAPSVVTILTPGGNGSGVVYTPDGLVITNEHVVRGLSTVQVGFADGQRVAGVVRAVDPVTDLALVQAERTGLPAARFQPAIPVVGALAVVIGSPLGFDNSVTVGVISGLHREIPGSATPGGAPPTQAWVDLIQTDAPISPGNSGGAVANAAGEVIGISQAYIPPQAGAVSLGFAIPAATVLDVAGQLMSTGRVRHAFAGLAPAPITPDIATHLGLPGTDGVIIAAVVPGGPVDDAGLRPGEVITAVDGATIRSPEDFLAQLRAHDPGDRLPLTVRGVDGASREATITLTDRPGTSR